MKRIIESFSAYKKYVQNYYSEIADVADKNCQLNELQQMLRLFQNRRNGTSVVSIDDRIGNI